tara:strand:- start:151 stop:357 length:207 start_codon:yes stop_codon:yes gene_type:complete
LENIETNFPIQTASSKLQAPNCLVIILKSEYPLNFFMEQTVTIIALNDPGNFVTADFQSFVSKLAFGD